MTLNESNPLILAWQRSSKSQPVYWRITWRHVGLSLRPFSALFASFMQSFGRKHLIPIYWSKQRSFNVQYGPLVYLLLSQSTQSMAVCQSIYMFFLLCFYFFLLILHLRYFVVYLPCVRPHIKSIFGYVIAHSIIV